MKKSIALLAVMALFVGFTAVAVVPLDTTHHADTVFVVQQAPATHGIDKEGFRAGVALIAKSIPGGQAYLELFLLIFTAVGLPMLATLQAALKKNPNRQRLSGFIGVIADILTLGVRDVQPKNPEAGPGPAPVAEKKTSI